MVISALIGAAGSLLGGFFGSDAAEDAAQAQADAVLKAQQIGIEQADKARADILSLYNPALSDFIRSLNSSIGQVRSGQADVFQILQNSTSNANEILGQTGSAVSNAILGLPITPVQYDQSFGQQTQTPGGFRQQPGATSFQGGDVIQTQRDPNTSVYGTPSGSDVISGEIGLQGMAQQGPPADYLLPTGVTREGFDQAYANTQNMTTNSVTGQPFTSEDQFRIAANQTQSAAEANARRNMGMSGRDAFDMGESRGVGSNNVLFPNWQQQTYGQPGQAPQTTGQPGADLASIAAPLNIGGQQPIQAQQNAPQATQGFNEQAYLQNKLAQLESLSPEERAAEESRRGITLPRTVDQLRQVLTGYGMTPEQHYQRYGISEGLTDTAPQQAPIDTGGLTGFAGARTALQDAQQGGLAQIAQGVNLATGNLNQYSGTGAQANQQAAAMSGALGPEAQAQAMAAYSESPGQRYLREQQEQALTRNASAIGGLGGGNVRTAIQEQAMGIASTDQQRYINNLMGLSNAGQQAAGQQGQFQYSGGIAGANLLQNIGGHQAGLAERTGLQLGNVQQGIGTALANNALGLGTNQANVAGQNSGTIANFLANQGTGQADLRTSLGSILANLATGSGSQQVNLALQGGNANAAGIMGQNNAWQSALQGVGGAAGGYFGQQSLQQPTYSYQNTPGAPYVQTGIDPYGR